MSKLIYWFERESKFIVSCLGDEESEWMAITYWTTYYSLSYDYYKGEFYINGVSFSLMFPFKANFYSSFWFLTLSASFELFD